MNMQQPAGINVLLGSPTGFPSEALPPVAAGLSPLKTYAAMANKQFIRTVSGGNVGHEQSRHPINRIFPGNFFHPPLFPLSHEHHKVDQGLKAMNMSNILNPGGSNVYENPAFVGAQNGENIGVAQGAFSPHKDQLKPGEHHHSVSYEDDENDPSVVIHVSDLENWCIQLQDRVIKGICHGVRPSLEALRGWISQTWENRNIRISHVQYLPNGYYLFFCIDSNFALQIVSQGQWLIRNTPISVFNWYMSFNPKGPKPTKAPVWVDFTDAPIELYPWLKPIGNSLGRVLGQRSRGGINPKFDPQLLIEVDLSKDLKYAIPVKDSCGRTLHIQKVVYKALPNACFNYMKLGHFIKECPELKKEEPVPVATEPERKDDFQPDRGEEQPQMVKENASHSDIHMDFTSNKKIPNLVSEKIAGGSHLNPDDMEKGSASTSSSDGEEDSIPNTQADGQGRGAAAQAGSRGSSPRGVWVNAPSRVKGQQPLLGFGAMPQVGLRGDSPREVWGSAPSRVKGRQSLVGFGATPRAGSRGGSPRGVWGSAPSRVKGR
ncbi:hypothetical protein L7F22_015699 [Adiantum nelumboides]|nr:hypothetical protein [Adiantum nelumboides]